MAALYDSPKRIITGLAPRPGQVNALSEDAKKLLEEGLYGARKVAPKAVGTAAHVGTEVATHVATHAAFNALAPGIGTAISLPVSIVAGQALGWMAGIVAENATKLTLDIAAAIGPKIIDNVANVANAVLPQSEKVRASSPQPQAPTSPFQIPSLKRF